MDMKAVSAIQKFTDARSIAAISNYAQSKPATAPDPVESTVSETVRSVAVDFAETLAKSEEAAKASMVGSADPHALVQALAQTELAVEAAVSVRNKVVEAYQEILRMPV